MSEVTRESLAAGLAENKAAIDKMATELATVHSELAKMAEMLEAYTAIKKGGKMLEWMSKVLAACLVIWAFVRGGLQFLAEIGEGA